MDITSTGTGRSISGTGAPARQARRFLTSAGIANPTLPHLVVMTYSGGSTATGSIYMDEGAARSRAQSHLTADI